MQTGETTFRTRRGQARPPTLGAGPKLLARPWGSRRGGFTLTEIMIAMGVLGIGMAMIAGALHAGIQLHVRTIDDIMRQLIGDNALAIVQTRVRHSATNGITDTYQRLGPSYFGLGDLKYPCDPQNTNPNTPYGAVVLMKRRADATTFANDYDIIIVPYTITPNTTGLGTVSLTTLPNCTVSSDGLTVTANNLVSGWVIIDSNGKVSTVASATSTAATMTDALTSGTTTLTTITVSNFNTGGRLECSKPVQTKTALSPSPSWTPGQP